MATEIKNEQIEQLTQQFKEMEVADLFKALKAGLTVAQSKASAKKAKAGSMPKGACPPQLKLNNAWVKHVKDYVNQNGWEAFSVPTTMTDKDTGAKAPPDAWPNNGPPGVEVGISAVMVLVEGEWLLDDGGLEPRACE